MAISAGLVVLGALGMLLAEWKAISRLNAVKDHLPMAREQWTAAGVSNYQIKIGTLYLWTLKEFRGEYLCGMIGDTLTVKDGQVVGASLWSDCSQVYRQLSVTGAFALVESYLDSTSPAIQGLEFDPDYGYLTRMTLQYPSSGHPITLKYSDLVILDE